MSDRDRLKLFNELCKACSRHRVIPKSMYIPDCSKGSVVVEHGGFANVSRGKYKGRQVAIKVLRASIVHDLNTILSVSVPRSTCIVVLVWTKLLQRFCREAVTWKHLRHPNILPLLGVIMSEHQFAMVSEWIVNGDIDEFIRRDRHVNRIELVSVIFSTNRSLTDPLFSWSTSQKAWSICIASALFTET